MLIDICKKLVWFKSYRADRMETRFCEGQSSKGNNVLHSARRTILALCMSSNAG